MAERIVAAVELAWHPDSGPTLRRQAFDYVNELRQEPTAWQPCLEIFTYIPRHSEVVRVFSLEIVNSAMQKGLLDAQSLKLVREQLMIYLERCCGGSEGHYQPDNPSIENKLAQTVTYLFAACYENDWQSIFDDLLALTKEKRPGSGDNLAGTIFYLRVINSVHDEIGDVLLSRSRAEQDRANSLKDLVRQRDVQMIARSWQDILTQWRTSNDTIAELCLKAVAKWVNWIDISLIVNQPMLEVLFQQLERAQKVQIQDGDARARDAAIGTFTEIVAKKMPAADKVNMIKFLNLSSIVTQLIACPPLGERRFSATYDTDLAETVAKLVNTTVIDIVRVLETETENTDVWRSAEALLGDFIPLLLRFFSDEYDEVCSTVISSMNDLLAYLRRVGHGDAVNTQRAAMLLPILKAIFAKMRYDETSSWGEDDELTDEAEFQDLRKRLATLQQAVAAADEQLYTDAVTALVQGTFAQLRTGAQVNWRDLDLALYQMYLFGDLAVKSGGLYQKNKPNSPAAEKLVEMMVQLVESNVVSFSHPAVQLVYMDLCARYGSFFEKHTQYIQPVLEFLLQVVHQPTMKVSTRSWYIFLRFVRQLRPHVGKVAEIVIGNISDLLVIKAETPAEGSKDDVSSDDDSATDTVFNSQLFLFDAAGTIAGAHSVPVAKQVQFVQAIVQPLMADIENHLGQARSGNQQALQQIHHDIMAVGTVARGFSDWIPVSDAASGNVPAEVVQEAYSRASEVILLALDTLKATFRIRDAARFTFSRLVGVMGSRILPQLPRWVDGLLTPSSSRDEMALFLRLLDQITFGFKSTISTFLDSLFGLLLQRVLSGLSAPVTGTDDEIEIAELKREYLSFLLVILNNGLGEIIVSRNNQLSFELLIKTIEQFAQDAEDVGSAKMAFQVLAKMCTAWGGPDVVPPTPPKGQQANGTIQSTTPLPTLPGFDQFMITRFSALCWVLPANPDFNAKDAEAKQVLTEAAALQKTIYTKTGQEYVNWLRNGELRNTGMTDAMVDDFVSKLATFDMKNWKVFFARFVSLGGKV